MGSRKERQRYFILKNKGAMICIALGSLIIPMAKSIQPVIQGNSL
jgi:hypothetical protein